MISLSLVVVLLMNCVYFDTMYNTYEFRTITDVNTHICYIPMGPFTLVSKLEGNRQTAIIVYVMEIPVVIE